MKKILKSTLICLLIIPLLMLCSCGGRSNLSSINMSRYYEADVTYYIYDNTSSKTTKLEYLTASEPADANFDSYTEITLTGIGSWLYKMYIDKIYFYVYTSENASEEMIINVTITNVLEESEFQNDEHTSTTFTYEVSLKPTKKKVPCFAKCQ